MTTEHVADAYILVPDEHGHVRLVEELALFDPVRYSTEELEAAPVFTIEVER